MKHRSLGVGLAGALFVWTATFDVGAQSPPAASAPPADPAPSAAPVPSAAPQPSLADTLFEEGRALMANKDYEHACPKFAESQSLDPAPGTLFNLATCEEKRGRFGSAARAWKEALAMLPKDDPRAQTVSENLANADKQAGHLVLRPAPTAPSSLEVRLDGAPLPKTAFGAAIPVDIGAHTLVVSAQGHAPRTLSVEAPLGPAVDVVLTPGAELPPPSAIPSATATTSATALQAPQTPPQSFGRCHVASFALGGAAVLVGAAAVGVGVDITYQYRQYIASFNATRELDKDVQASLEAKETATNVLAVAAGVTALSGVAVFAFAERCSPRAPTTGDAPDRGARARGRGPTWTATVGPNGVAVLGSF